MSEFTETMSPTRPRSISPSFFSAENSLPDFPDIPTALPPNLFILATIPVFIFPMRTIFTISIVSSSVTLRPSMNVGAFPKRCIAEVISGPPPCMITGFIFTWFSKITSWAIASRTVSSSRISPPIFIMNTCEVSIFDI